MLPSLARERFDAALAQLIDRVKLDRSILAAVLCGSLSHDTVWDKSDIDLMLITTDDKQPPEHSLALHADGVNVHAMLIPRAKFRQSAESAIRSGFLHSFLAKGRLLYTHDDSLTGILEQLTHLGDRDLQLQLLNAGACALGPLYKAHKWFRTRRDLEYTALWILYTATPLAKIEILTARQLVDREVLPQALKLNPAFFKLIYTDLLNAKKSAKTVQAALTAIDAYLAERAPQVFRPVTDYLIEVGEARSATEIDDHFKRNFGLDGVTGICEYLSDQGLIGKTGLPVRLTKRSNIDVEELAFFHAS